jgi:hypothetical protein
MQIVLLVPEADWLALVAEVEQLKQTVVQLAPPAKLPDRLHNVREAAHYLRLTPEGVRKARRQGHLSGGHLNEKEWGFRQSELDRYLTRYNRHPLTSSE